MKNHSMFSAASTALVRVAALPASDGAVTRVDLAADEPGYPDRLSRYVRTLAGNTALREAVEISSESVGEVLARVESGVPVDAAPLERVAFALTRYLLRMTGRPTPFGLMAGVALGRVGEDLKVRVGDQHRRHARVDAQWLALLTARLEAQPEVRRSLRVMTNDLAVERGDRLVLPYACHGAPDKREVSIRHTPVVRAALDLARRPVRWTVLEAALRREFPQADEEAVTALLGRLLEEEFLLSDLTPPFTHTDPLGYLRGRLTGHADEAGLARVAGLLSDYTTRPLGEGRDAWHAVTAELRGLQPTDRLPVQVDLQMDVDLVLPPQVAREVERVVSALWRTRPEGGTDRHLAEYRAAILDRYGAGVPVPVLELLDPHRGIDAPAGYRRPPSARSAEAGPARAADLAREDLVAELLQRAWRRGEPEIVLDDRIIDRLAREPGQAPPPSLEVCLHLSAESASAVEDGRYGLCIPHVAMESAGALAGRFAHLLNAGQELSGLLEPAARTPGAPTPVQLLFRPAMARAGNVCRVPRLVEKIVSVGSFAEADDPGAIDLRDVAVGATPERLYVVDLRDGREIAPFVPHALSLDSFAPNAVRLLSEITTSGEHFIRLWDWDRFEALPYLPRVRYGRTVVAQARWRPGPALSDAKRSWPEWCAELDAWRAEWQVPDLVHATMGDHRIELDLASPLHRRLLRQELRRKPDLVLVEPPPGGQAGLGWLDGYTSEIIVSLAGAAAPPPAPPARRRTAGSVERPRHAPGGEWLFAKIYARGDLHDALIAAELPRLRVPEWVDRWFLMRYRDPDAHVRIRFHGDPRKINSELLPALHEWERSARNRGVISRLVLDTYEPEADRYGGPEALPDAERFFQADSESVIGQLQTRAEHLADLPVELLAAMNYVDILRSAGEWDWARWVVSSYDRQAFRTIGVSREHLALVDPDGRWDLLRQLIPGAGRLLACWRHRAPAAAGYGRHILAAPDDRALSSVLHLHANRLIGMDRELEGRSLAILRSVAHSHLVRTGGSR